MKNLSIQAEALQNLLVARATGTEESEADFTKLRLIIEKIPKSPDYLKTCRTLTQFWQFIKGTFPTYAERREYIWSSFRPLLESLDDTLIYPSDTAVTNALLFTGSESIKSAWSKALDRRFNDPEGAITSARTLLEATCKHILDKNNVAYGDAPDLNKLYNLTSEQLGIAPSQHTEQIFKQILGGCTSVVQGLGALRNKVSDAHGQGVNKIKPDTRHAELAVNLAGALAMFLTSTWDNKRN